VACETVQLVLHGVRKTPYPIEAGLLLVALGPCQVAQPVILGFCILAGAVVEGCTRDQMAITW
jgi:hypothetical protein